MHHLSGFVLVVEERDMLVDSLRKASERRALMGNDHPEGGGLKADLVFCSVLASMAMQREAPLRRSRKVHAA